MAKRVRLENEANILWKDVSKLTRGRSMNRSSGAWEKQEDG